MVEIIKYKEEGVLPEDPVRAKNIKNLAPQCRIINDEIYKVAKNGPILKCVTPEEAEYILRETHEGVCGHHQGAKSLAHTAFRAGYYWLNTLSDAKSVVENCKKCQKLGPNINTPSNQLKFIHNPIPFAQWGLDLLGPFLVALGVVRFLILGVDYFTKWVEAESLATITSRKVERFIWHHIIIRFGLRSVLTIDNGKQFDCNTLRKYLSGFKINVAYSSISNPQWNGQVEATNKQILNGLKIKLDEAKGRWSEFLYDVLWSLRTTPKYPTGQSSFRLVNGTEALLPIELAYQPCALNVMRRRKT